MIRNVWLTARACCVALLLLAAVAAPQREAEASAACYTDSYCIDDCGSIPGYFESACEQCFAAVACVPEIGQGCTAPHLPGTSGEGFVYWCEYQS